MGAYQNAIQSAEIAITAMVGTLLHSAFDALIGIVIHDLDLLF